MKAQAVFTLSINDPREGWKYAKDLTVKNLNEAYAQVTVAKAKYKKYGFALRIESVDRKQNKTFVLRRGKFIGLTDNMPVENYLGGLKPKTTRAQKSDNILAKYMHRGVYINKSYSVGWFVHFSSYENFPKGLSAPTLDRLVFLIDRALDAKGG